MRLLYDAGPQLLKVRAIMLLSLLCAAGCLWWGIDLTRTYGLAPGDGGKLQPLPVRLAWGVGVALLGLSFMAGMELYARCYVRKIELDPGRDELHLYTLGFLGGARHTLTAADVSHTRRHSGRLDLDVSVAAPWQSVVVRGRRTPLIVDEQGTFHDRTTLVRFFG